MKILIHALGAAMGGGLRHLTNFLPALGKVDPNNEYVAFIRKSIPVFSAPENITIKRVSDQKASRLINRITGDLIQLPLKLKRENFEIIVSLMNFGPIITSTPHILFQANPTYFCRYLLDSLKGKKKIEVYLRRLWSVESMKRADLIVTPSNAMADMIRETCPTVKRRNFQTLFHGFNDQSLKSAPDERYIKLLAFDGYKLLYPTHAAPHKGFEILFKMLFHLKKQMKNFALFVPICNEDWPKGILKFKTIISNLNLQENVVFLGRVPQSQMGYLYQNCDLMVYPSLCESFGFSMIEAMGFGLPIVASGTSINREMCADGALYYNPLDAVGGAEAIIEALKPQIRDKLIKNGQLRYRSYDWSWNRCAKEFVNLFKEIGL